MCFFFFQAEDGIRDIGVTGVQTCALPISAERADPKIIDGSRRSRIARGSGRQVSDVNNLVDRFFEARKMMMQMAKGGIPGLPGMPGMAGGGKRGKKAPARKGKGRRVSGNPAKAAAQAAAEKDKVAASAGANPFGTPLGGP